MGRVGSWALVPTQISCPFFPKGFFKAGFFWPPSSHSGFVRGCSAPLSVLLAIIG